MIFSNSPQGLRLGQLAVGVPPFRATLFLTQVFYFVLPICREPRGFGFVQFVDPADAQEAKYQMDGQILLGRQLTVVFAEENRKKPTDMRQRERR